MTHAIGRLHLRIAQRIADPEPVHQRANTRRRQTNALSHVRRGAAVRRGPGSDACRRRESKSHRHHAPLGVAGCRREGIPGLKWSEIDFGHACLRLESTKTGRSVRPLAGAAIAVLKSIAPTAGSPYVFPTEDANAATYYQGTKRFWPNVVERAGLPGVTPHTLRHTIGSAPFSSGETLAMTGALLGHADGRSTSIYAHMQQDPIRRAADRVVAPIATALGLQMAAEVLGISKKR